MSKLIDVTNMSEEEVDDLLGYDPDYDALKARAKHLKRKGLSFEEALQAIEYDGDHSEAVRDAYGIDPETDRSQADDTPHASIADIDRALAASKSKTSRADIAAMNGYENYIHTVADTQQGRLS